MSIIPALKTLWCMWTILDDGISSETSQSDGRSCSSKQEAVFGTNDTDELGSSFSTSDGLRSNGNNAIEQKSIERIARESERRDEDF